MTKKNIYWSLGLHLIVFLIFSIDIYFFSKQVAPSNDEKILILDLADLEPAAAPKIFELKPIEQEDPAEVEVIEKVQRRADMSKLFSTLQQLRNETEEEEKKRLEEEKKLKDEEQRLADEEEAKKKKEEEDQRRLAEMQRAKKAVSLQKTITMAEHDEVSRRLKACWNVDTGKKNIESSIIEIRVKLTPDGGVKSYEFVNKGVMKNPHTRSVAESAERAILKCGMKDENESPFKYLAKMRPKEYDVWETLFLRFNPIDGGVM